MIVALYSRNKQLFCIVIIRVVYLIDYVFIVTYYIDTMEITYIKQTNK
jgi:hypothetical protein